MKNALNDLLNFFALSLIIDKGFWDFCAVSRIRFQDWPDCFARTVAMQYAELRTQLGHDMAAVQLSGHIERLGEQDGFPADPGLLLAYYESTLKEFRAKRLAQQLLEDPLSAEKHISQFESEATKDELVSFAANVENIFRESVRLAETGEALRSIPRWPILSNAIGGFNPGRVGMLMAQTGFGKTTAAANLALAAASRLKVVYFNMEMVPQDFGEKLILSELRESFYSLKNAPLGLANALAHRMPQIFQKSLVYSQGRAMTPNQIFAVCRREKSERGVDLVVVDYDQKLIMDTGKDTPEWKALQIAVEQFESLAKEIGVFVLILAQESSDGEVSGSKRSKFPASTVLRFFKNDDGQFLIQAVKNRFGKRNAAVEVKYEAEKSYIEEIREFEPNPVQRESSIASRPKTPMGTRGSTFTTDTQRLRTPD